MLKSRKVVKTAFIMVLFGLGSKLLGYVREMLIAAKFGAGAETDTFFIAITAVSLFTSMFIQALNNTTVPLLSDIEIHNGKQAKRTHINNLINIVLVITILTVFMGWALAPIIMKAIAYGFGEQQLSTAIYYMRIGLIAVIFAGIIGVFRGYLQSESRFIETAASQLAFSSTYIVYLLLLSPIFGIIGLVVASVIAVAAQIIIQIPGLKRIKYKYRFILNFKDKYIKRTFYLALPVFAIVLINDVNRLIDKALASTLVEGSISALNYSQLLNNIILAVFITVISTVIFPSLAHEATNKNYDKLKKLIKNGTNVIVLITIPATVGIIILAEPIVRIAFERGAFDAAATDMTYIALIFYSLGLIGMALRLLIEKVYYSLHDSKTPMFFGFIAVILNIGLNLLLIKPMAHGGLALATSIAMTLAAILLFWRLKKKIGKLGLSDYFRCGVKALIAASVMGFSIYMIFYSFSARASDSFILELILLIGTFLVGMTIYLGVLYLLKVDELKWLLNILKAKIKKA